MEESDTCSEGSDFDVSSLDDFNDFPLDGTVPMEPLDIAQLLGNDSDDEEADFGGFHEDWTQNPDHFNPNHRAPFRGIPGPQAVHPEEARAVDYFSFFYDQDTWERLVTGECF